MNDPMTEVRFWQIVVDESRRTVMCSPDLESRVKGWVDTRGLAGVITVVADPACPDDRIYLVDTGALEALRNEVLAGPVRFRW